MVVPLPQSLLFYVLAMSTLLCTLFYLLIDELNDKMKHASFDRSHPVVPCEGIYGIEESIKRERAPATQRTGY